MPPWFSENSFNKEETAMSTQNVEKEIISIISEVSGFDEKEITTEKNLAEDLEIDSIKAIEITVALEKKFNVSVRDEDIPKITTVRESVELVKNLLNTNNSQ
jgi:acyl carrier protein